MKWDWINIIGVVLIGTVAAKYYKEGTSYIATTGNTAAQLYSTVSLTSSTPVGPTSPSIVR